MKSLFEFLTEAPLVSVKKKTKFNPETGRRFDDEEAEKIGTLDKEHDLYHKPEREYIKNKKTGNSSYYSVHRGTGKVTATVYGKRNPRSGSFEINTTDSTGSGPKAHKIYRKILQSGHSTTLVGKSHSEGGQKIWQKLSSERGVSVYGWHRNKPVNIDPKDPEETHVSSKEVEAGGLKGDPVGKKIYKMKLVASLHKRKTV